MQERDALGLKLTVHLLHQPDPMFYTAEEIEGCQGSEEDPKDLPADKQPPKAGKRPFLLALVIFITIGCYAAGDRMAGSYVNFYIANKTVVAPAFGDAKHDEEARIKVGL